MRAVTHRFYVPSYSYKVKVKNRFRVVKVSAHVQRRKITNKNLKKNYRFNKKLRAYLKIRRRLYCLYFFTLKFESGINFTNAKYQITNSKRNAINKAIKNPEITFFLTDRNVIRYDILELNKYTSIAPYLKIWSAERYHTFNSKYGEREYKKFITRIKKKYGLKDVPLPTKYERVFKALTEDTQFMSSRERGLR